jgi:hypothetical protein
MRMRGFAPGLARGSWGLQLKLRQGLRRESTLG